jgi:predicted flap endonuclease-1-like 5' DNA nuclease
MPEWLNDFWPVVLIAVLICAILAFLLLRPRQKVRLSDSAPTRPHMVERDQPQRGEGRSIADTMAAATSDVTGDIIEAPVHAHLPGASGPPDDLQRLKGVGPKFAEILNERGIIRFEQLARLGPDEVQRLDPTLGPFRGRLTRDRVTEQADYLARGDVDGFEARFGKL